MTKFYAFIAAAAMTCSANAQSLQFEDHNSNQTVSQIHKAQETIDGTYLWGYWSNESFDDIDAEDRIKELGLQEDTYDFDICMKVPGLGKLKGSTIQAINVPVNHVSELSNYKVYIMDKDMTTILQTQSVSTSSMEEYSYCTVKLSKPFTITDDVYVGTQFRGKSINGGESIDAMLIDKGANQPGSFYWNQKGKWLDFSTTYGSLLFQLQVTDAKIGANSAYFGNFTEFTLPNQDCVYNVDVFADGEVNVEDIQYTLTVGDETDTYFTEVPITAGVNSSNKVEISFTSPSEPGDYTVDLAITKVNGEDNVLKDNITKLKFTNVTKKVQRRTVMEEFTGCWCGYCPRGFAGIKTLYNYYPEKFIAISVHYADPMDIDCYGLSTSDYPGCQLDRSGVFVDPFFGSSMLTSPNNPTCEGIVQDFAVANEKVFGADVTATAVWEGNDYKKVTINATAEGLIAGTYTPLFVLTADELYKKDANWMQTNYMYKWSQEAWHGNDELGKYCKDGEFGQEKFLTSYDDVMIGSSYKKVGTEAVNQTSSITLEANETKDFSYTISLPTSTGLYNAIMDSKDKVYGIVIMLNEDGTIANACKTKVTSADGIGTVIAEPQENSIEAVYGLDGRRTNGNASGISIVKMSNGSSKKVIK